MSPGVLASMWKEEEVRTRELEEKMKILLKNKGVRCISYLYLSKPINL